jgi:hypothetical protein
LQLLGLAGNSNEFLVTEAVFVEQVHDLHDHERQPPRWCNALGGNRR